MVHIAFVSRRFFRVYFLMSTPQKKLVSIQVPTSAADLSCSGNLSSISPGATITCQALIAYKIHQVNRKYYGGNVKTFSYLRSCVSSFLEPCVLAVADGTSP